MIFLLLTLPTLLGVSELHLVLDQPFFPGKVILWLLFMLSLASWAVIASKIVSIRKFREGDRVFTNQLRRSKKPLEIHEKDWNEPMSLRQEVYDAGANEAAFQLLGAIRQKKNAQSVPETLTDGQMIGLRDALQRGIKAAESRLAIGMPILQATAAGAPFLGLLGMIWIMMGSFGENAAPEQISKGLSSALGVMAIALFAATPAIIAHILLRSSCRTYLHELGDFRLELNRLFERSLAAVWNSVDQPKPTKPVTFRDEPTKHGAAAQNIKTRVFKSIRQDEPMINPIARKAKEAAGQG